MVKTAKRTAPYLLILLPIALSFIFVGLFGVNVVFRDQWEMAGLFGKLYSGELLLSDLWEPHNEHRFFFPRIAMLALGTLTNWNSLAEMYMIQLCLIATLTALFLAFRDTLGMKPLMFAPIAFAVFSLRQWFNMLWGYQLTFAFTQTFGVLALYFLYRTGVRSPGVFFPIAVLCATLSAGSSVQGLLVWPAGLLLLALLSVKVRTRGLLVAPWAALGLIEWIFYFVGYDSGVGSSLPRLLSSPLASVEYFLTVIGNSLVSRPGFVMVCGVALTFLVLAGSALSLRESERSGYSFWIALSAFSLLIAASITAGRGDMGPETALAPRYTTFSLLAVVGAYAIFARLRKDRGGHLFQGAFATLTTVVLLSIPVSYSNGFQLGAAEQSSRQKASKVLQDYESRSDEELRMLHRHPEIVRHRAPLLERLDYNVFSR